MLFATALLEGVVGPDWTQKNYTYALGEKRLIREDQRGYYEGVPECFSVGNEELGGSGVGLPIGREIFTSGSAVNSIDEDNGAMVISNSASNGTYTLQANTCNLGVAILMRGTGLVTLAAGAGVSFIATQTQTYTQGDIIYAIPTQIDNEFCVKVA